MESGLTLEVSLNDTICDRCKNELTNDVVCTDTQYELIRIDVPDFDSKETVKVTLDVKEIKWNKEGEGFYTAHALMSLSCPCCEKPQELKYRLKAPSIFLIDTFVCETCGGHLEFEDKELLYKDSDKKGSLIEIRGNLICPKCSIIQSSEIKVSSLALPPLMKTDKLEMILTDQTVQINDRSFDVSAKRGEHKMFYTTVLVVFANPKGSDPLRLGNEDRVIHQCIERCKYRDNIKLEIKHAARIDDLARALLDGEYRIVQFSGHGTGMGLAFENELGEVKIVPKEALDELLSAYCPPIECVILNACYSDVHSKYLATGVPYTIVMSGPISDEGATEFTRGFYDAIGAGKTLKFAYQEGCRRIKLQGLPDKTVPAFYEKYESEA